MYVIHKIFEYHAPNPIFALLYLFVVLFAHFLIELTLFFRAILHLQKNWAKSMEFPNTQQPYY